MEEFDPYHRVEPGDPDQCQHVIPSKGQCLLNSCPNTNFCINHGGAKALHTAEENSKRLYRLAKWQNRVDELADHDQIKSLRAELGILRMLVEERIRFCNTPTDLMLQSTVISDLVMKVEKMTSSCTRLDSQLGKMLDTTQALQFAAEIIEIVARHVEDEDTLCVIADEIQNRLGQSR